MALVNNFSKNFGVFDDVARAQLHSNLMTDLKKFVEGDIRPGSCKLLSPRDCALILDFYEDNMIRQLVDLIHENLEGFVEIYEDTYKSNIKNKEGDIV